MSNRFTSALRQIGPSLILRSALMAGALIGAGLLLETYKFQQIVDYFRFSPDAGAGWGQGRLAFFALSAAFTAMGGPRQAVAFFAAYFFGFTEGFLLALAATLAGCVGAVAAASSFRTAANRFVSGKLDVALQLWRLNPFEFSFLIRLLPVGSNLVTNLAAGATSIPLAGFLGGTLLGYIPQTLVFALMGSGVNIGSKFQIWLSIVLFAASLAIGVRIYARYRRDFKVRQKRDEAD